MLRHYLRRLDDVDVARCGPPIIDVPTDLGDTLACYATAAAPSTAIAACSEHILESFGQSEEVGGEIAYHQHHQDYNHSYEHFARESGPSTCLLSW